SRHAPSPAARGPRRPVHSTHGAAHRGGSMARADRSDPWAWALGVFGLVNLANAAWMLAAPGDWYARLPAAVPDTGPFNAHFVGDIGGAFAMMGLGLGAGG